MALRQRAAYGRSAAEQLTSSAGWTALNTEILWEHHAHYCSSSPHLSGCSCSCSPSACQERGTSRLAESTETSVNSPRPFQCPPAACWATCRMRRARCSLGCKAPRTVRKRGTGLAATSSGPQGEPRSGHVALPAHLRLSTLLPPKLAAQAQVSEMLLHLQNRPLPSPSSAILLQGNLQSGTRVFVFRLPSHHRSFPLQDGPCSTSSRTRPATALTFRRERSWQGGRQTYFG